MTNELAAGIPIARTVAAIRELVSKARARGERISLVPTMGALHEGHLSLIRNAAGDGSCVVLSIFVNPTQFNEQSDLAAYPRTEEQDVRLAAAAGCTVVFAPDAAEVYPEGFDSYIDVGAVTHTLEGAARGAGHFRGVATVVGKLFNIVAPDVAWFGAKDAQQVMVIRQLVRDLNFNVAISVGETVREADGLALSSRNVRLSTAARTDALGIVAALRRARELAESGVTSAAELREAAFKVLEQHGILRSATDYVAIVDAETFAELQAVSATARMAIAAHVGGVRLIDNMLLKG